VLGMGLRVVPDWEYVCGQMRLHDGTRITQRFNLSHTVGHIYAYVASGERIACVTSASVCIIHWIVHLVLVYTGGFVT
jgi:hypothetical protein